MCEHFYAVLLDNKHRRIRDVLVSKGSLTVSVVRPGDVFHQVVRHSAAAVAFVHNLCGAPHNPGHFGHFGLWERGLRVVRVLKVQRIKE